MARTLPLMLHGSASVVVLWRALAKTGGARACRRRSDSGGSGWMARTWPWMLHRGASVVVLSLLHKIRHVEHDVEADVHGLGLVHGLGVVVEGPKQNGQKTCVPTVVSAHGPCIL